MLQDPTVSNTVSWTSTGLSFIVKDPAEFAKYLLPLHFKHGNFASFVRQLNKYDFHKVKSSEDSRLYGSQVRLQKLIRRLGNSVMRFFKKTDRIYWNLSAANSQIQRNLNNPILLTNQHLSRLKKVRFFVYHPRKRPQMTILLERLVKGNCRFYKNKWTLWKKFKMKCLYISRISQ